MEMLSEQIKMTQVIDVTTGAAGATAINGNRVDMQGYEGVMFVCVMGAIVTNAVTSLKAQQGNSSSGPTNLADAADLLGTGMTIADDDDGQVFVLDIYRPLERYVRPVVSRATQNATVQTCLAIQYGARSRATALAITDAITVEKHVSPAEGTA
ncbi:MAG: hypothetical protein KF770_10655 [Anaerolineae bacterium]|nr:hypothetical protein [Anaerolineae bacterium]